MHSHAHGIAHMRSHTLRLMRMHSHAPRIARMHSHTLRLMHMHSHTQTAGPKLQAQRIIAKRSAHPPNAHIRTQRHTHTHARIPAHTCMGPACDCQKLCSSTMHTCSQIDTPHTCVCTHARACTHVLLRWHRHIHLRAQPAPLTRKQDAAVYHDMSIVQQEGHVRLELQACVQSPRAHRGQLVGDSYKDAHSMTPGSPYLAETPAFLEEPLQYKPSVLHAEPFHMKQQRPTSRSMFD